MSEELSDSIVDRAIAWHQAVAADSVDWAALTDWLAADPAHASAFDEITLIDDAVDRHRGTIAALAPREAAPIDDAPARRAGGWRWWAGGGVAAALALVVAVPMLTTPDAAPIVYASQGSQPRDVTLNGGARVTLSAASRISVAKHGERITLDDGDAYFDVPHDPARRLEIIADGYRIADIGTRFSVDAGGGHVSVAVAEGEVTVTPPAGDAVTLGAGQRMTGAIGGAAAAPRVASVAPASVAAWRQGRLVYDDVPLAMVAADISRYRGAPVMVDRSLEGRRFSGVLVIGDGSTLVSDFAGLAGLRVVPRGDGVVLRGGRVP